jgi:hypothetical protein
MHHYQPPMDRKLVPLGRSSTEVRRDQRSVDLTIRPKEPQELTGETAKGQPWPMGQKTPTVQLADERGRRIWSVRGPLSSWNSCRRSSLCHRTCSNRSYSCCRTREVGRWHRGDRVADTRSTWGGGRSGHKSSLGDHLGLVGEPEFLEGQHRTRFGERMHRGEYFEETAGAMVEKDYLH